MSIAILTICSIVIIKCVVLETDDKMTERWFYKFSNVSSTLAECYTSVFLSDGSCWLVDHRSVKYVIMVNVIIV